MCGARPDEDGWLTVQVAALHGYLVDLSEPDVLDQADELSALTRRSSRSGTSTATPVLALETADRPAPFDSVALLGALVNLLEKAASLLRERQAYALADHLRLVKGRPSRTVGARTYPALVVGPRVGALSIIASWPGPLRLINNPHRARSAPQ